MKLQIITPNGAAEAVECDSVRLIMANDAEGKGGGSIGIRKGHADAVIALEPQGKAEAFLEGNLVFSRTLSGGFALVKSDAVSILTEKPAEE